LLLLFDWGGTFQAILRAGSRIGDAYLLAAVIIWVPSTILGIATQSIYPPVVATVFFTLAGSFSLASKRIATTQRRRTAAKRARKAIAGAVKGVVAAPAETEALENVPSVDLFVEDQI
jgi:hypothetical protein